MSTCPDCRRPVFRIGVGKQGCCGAGIVGAEAYGWDLECHEAQIARLRRRLWEKRRQAVALQLESAALLWRRERRSARTAGYAHLCEARYAVAESRLARVRAMTPPGVVGSVE